MCTQMRGVREHEPMTRTTAYRGTYVAERSMRSEFFDLIRMGSGTES
jgi:GTP cyclohydrolase I